MSTLKRFTHDSVGYFESLPKGTQELVRDLILEAASQRRGPEGYRSDKESIDSIECHSRDGFTAYSHNKGGLVYRNFATLMDYFGGGYDCAHALANSKIEQDIEKSFKDCAETLYDRHKSLCLALNISQEDCTYNALEEFERTPTLLSEDQRKELKRMVSEVQDLESEYLSGENSTIMHEFRVMYHGRDAHGLHSASVSAAINLEAPYHRSHISWAPNVFCEGAKEVEISWRNKAELRRKLARALKQVSKAIF